MQFYRMSEWQMVMEVDFGLKYWLAYDLRILPMRQYGQQQLLYQFLIIH